MAKNPRSTGRKNPEKKAPVEGRDAHGRFVVGGVANPKGRPAILSEVRDLARQRGPAAIARLAALMYSPDGPTAIAAARELLNRAYGRPEQFVSTNGGTSVNINMASLPIMDAVTASRLYQESMREGGTIEIDQLRFAPVEERVRVAPLPDPPTEPMQEPSSNNDPSEDTPAAPSAAPEPFADTRQPATRWSLWEKLAKPT